MDSVDISRLDKNSSPVIMLYSAHKTLTFNHISFWIELFIKSNINFSILVRDRKNFKILLAKYPLAQILYAKSPVDVETVVLSQPNLKKVFYFTNLAKNIHLLRFNHLTHIFIGTKNSEHLSKIGKSYRAYDEIWVSSQYQIDKFKNTIDTRHLIFRVIGKPQLKNILTKSNKRDIKTNNILYIINSIIQDTLNEFSFFIEHGYNIFIIKANKSSQDTILINSLNNTNIKLYRDKSLIDNLSLNSDAIFIDNIKDIHIWLLSYKIPIFMKENSDNDIDIIDKKTPIECINFYNKLNETLNIISNKKYNSKCLNYYLNYENSVNDSFIRLLKSEE